MNSTKKTIENIVSNIDLNIYVDIVSANVLKSNNTLYLMIGDLVKDEVGNIYKVDNLVVNGQIDLVPLVLGDVFVGSFLEMHEVSKPNFLIGYPSSANNEYLQMSKRTRDKLPLVWLLLGYEENLGGRDASVITVNNTTLFFLTETNEREWLTDEHFDIAIERMNNLVDRFLSYFDNHLANRYVGSSKKPLPRFGVYVRNGAEQRIIDDYLSGVQLKLDLELTKKCEC